MGLLELLIVIVLVFWLAGAVIYPVGGLIHLLLVVVLVLIVIRVLQGRSIL
jgi:hypothetical protein